MRTPDRDWELSERIWMALQVNVGKSVRELTLETNGKGPCVQKALYDMRKRGIASMTGATWTNRWFRVPGAQYENLRGRHPKSRGSLHPGGKPRAEKPDLSWSSVLGL